MRILAEQYPDVGPVPESRHNSVWLTTGDAARRLGVSTEAVRQFARAKRLACMRVESGQHFFHEEDVRQLALQRAEAPFSIVPPVPRRDSEPRQLRLRLYRSAGRKVT